MRRINHLPVVLSLLSVMACIGNGKITSDTNILPVSSCQFISDHFEDTPASHIRIEKNLIRISSYDVTLTNGTDVELSHRGEWRETKWHGFPIPPTIISGVIQDLIKKNYSSDKVVKVGREIRDYEIELDNGLEMTLGLKGNLIDIDD